MKDKIKINFKLLMHIIAWAIIFLLPYIFTTAKSESIDDYWHNENDYLSLDTITKIFWVGLFYLNFFILVPRFVYLKKYVLFGLLQVICFAVVMILHGGLFSILIKYQHFNFLISSGHNFMAFIFTVMASITCKTIVDKIELDTIAKEKQNEKLKTELSFLRSQISPHFLFNVLNNLVAMSRLKSDELEPTLIKLSLLLKYMLYETDEEKVLLKNEVDYLENYIELQKQRFGNTVLLNILFDLKEDWHTLEPMLLIPFVENAFKHGIGLVQNPEIDITLLSDKNTLNFIVKNKFKNDDFAKDRTSGIGLANVKRRLELLYPDTHRLSILNTNDIFSVSLQLAFKQ